MTDATQIDVSGLIERLGTPDNTLCGQASRTITALQAALTAERERADDLTRKLAEAEAKAQREWDAVDKIAEDNGRIANELERKLAEAVEVVRETLRAWDERVSTDHMTSSEWGRLYDCMQAARAFLQQHSQEHQT